MARGDSDLSQDPNYTEFRRVKMSDKTTEGSKEDSQRQQVTERSSTNYSEGCSHLNRPGPSSRNDEIVGDNFFVTLLDQFGSSESQSPNLAMSSTSSIPSRTKFPGDFEFRVEYNLQTSHRRNIGFSEALNKLFLTMDSWVEVRFLTNSSLPEGMLVRIVPVYVSPSDLTSPVVRCPHHAQEDDPSNNNFEFVHHLIRSQIFDVYFMSPGCLQIKPRTILGKMLLTPCLLLDKSNAIYEVWS